jgi:uncharacterized protein (DUF2336 family)
MSIAHASLIDELETAVKAGSPQDRVTTLRRITDLFLYDSERLSDEQIKVFDDVLCVIAERLEKTALAELGERLAPVDNAPLALVRRLARDDEIVVAGPVLSGSKRLSTHDLIEVAQTKSQAHLLAISERPVLQPALTDVLLDRGNQGVVIRLATNTGAQFSAAGFNRLMEKSGGDDTLAAIVGARRDIPVNILRELLQRATAAVRDKILALVSSERRDEVERVIAEITKTMTAAATEHDYAAAEAVIDELEHSGRLNEAALLKFVQSGRCDEMIVALARLCRSSNRIVGELLGGPRNDAVLVPCRAADLQWSTVEAILLNRLPNRKASNQILELARNDYARLAMATAQRTLRFMQVRETVR